MAILYADGSSSADGRLVQTVRYHIPNANIRTTTTTQSWRINESDVSGAPSETCEVSITPKAATNKLLITAMGTWYYITGTNGNHGQADVRIYDTTTSNEVAFTEYTGYAYTGGHNRDGATWALNCLIEADHNSSGTNARTYAVYYYFSGAQTFYYGIKGDSITVQEISASS
tara:strand:+ start:46 stop:561 length:516 start_codon:yes stop_codon:yes gene_type:complete